MNTSADVRNPPLSVPLRVVAIRAAILTGLSFLLFRDSLYGKSTAMINSSEWSHALAWPVLVAVYLWCRRDELRSRATEGSNFGLLLFIFGAFFYFVVRSLGLFSHLFVVALLLCLAGAIWYAVGWKALRVCVPLLALLFLSIPLSERSMDRFTLGIQRESLRATAFASMLLPSIELRSMGKELTYTYDGRSGYFVVAEQRFGARWLPAYATIGLFVVFCRRRTMARVITCLVFCIPVAIVCKLLHLLAWATVSVYGGFDPVSAVPRNIALIFALVAMYAGVALACWFVDKLASIPEVFVVESSDEEDAEAPAA